MDINLLVNQIVFGKKKEEGERKIRDLAKNQGIKLSSTQKLYEKLIKEKHLPFTVPAINIRTLTFDIACSIFRQVLKKKVGFFIFELARSEMSYTNQFIDEYILTILSAAIKEKFQGPLFFQGDHYQVNPKKFFTDSQREIEIKSLKNLIKKSIKAGAYNIDIDASTLVDIEKPDLKQQQKENYKITAQLTSYIRNLESSGITVAIGGEVGEIGKKNTTPEEIEAFMKGYNQLLPSGQKGLIKISVQSGATHGGITLSDGTLKKIKIDFETLEKTSKIAREFGMAGVVQHGASTLPEEYFDKFPKVGACEIHLATAFQNLIYDSQHFPDYLREKIYKWCLENFKDRKKEKESDKQFLYRFRKRALGSFKKEIWNIPQKNRDNISEELEEKISLIFQKLGVSDTTELAKEIYYF